jgi:hypothetical protein
MTKSKYDTFYTQKTHKVDRRRIYGVHVPSAINTATLWQTRDDDVAADLLEVTTHHSWLPGQPMHEPPSPRFLVESIDIGIKKPPLSAHCLVIGSSRVGLVDNRHLRHYSGSQRTNGMAVVARAKVACGLEALTSSGLPTLLKKLEMVSARLFSPPLRSIESKTHRRAIPNQPPPPPHPPRGSSRQLHFGGSTANTPWIEHSSCRVRHWTTPILGNFSSCKVISIHSQRPREHLSGAYATDSPFERRNTSTVPSPHNPPGVCLLEQGRGGKGIRGNCSRVGKVRKTCRSTPQDVPCPTEQVSAGSRQRTTILYRLLAAGVCSIRFVLTLVNIHNRQSQL